MQSKTKNYISLALWIIGLLTVSYIMGMVTKNNIGNWYNSLNRSSLTPPNYIFGIVWTILYIMIAISGWIIWNKEASKDLKTLYISQLILNWAWTPLFFGMHLTGAALICLMIIFILVAMLIVKSYKSVKPTSLLLMPYFIWISFAGYLNFYIWTNN